MKKAFINTPEYHYYDSENLVPMVTANFVVIDNNDKIIESPSGIITRVSVPLYFTDTPALILFRIADKIRETYEDNSITIHI